MGVLEGCLYECTPSEGGGVVRGVSGMCCGCIYTYGRVKGSHLDGWWEGCSVGWPVGVPVRK